MASRYGDRLRSYLVRRVRNRDDAPDLAQEVFLRLMVANLKKNLGIRGDARGKAPRSKLVSF
jgi:hypothetical protein